MTIFTIGYEGANVGCFTSCLKENRIDLLVDVRQSPFSRKPGFSRKTLESSLRHEDLVYIHSADLGCPRIIRDEYRGNKDWSLYCKKYNDYLQLQNEALDKVYGYSTNFRCALMCFEANPYECHRLLIAQKLISDYPSLTIKNLSTCNSL